MPVCLFLLLYMIDLDKYFVSAFRCFFQNSGWFNCEVLNALWHWLFVRLIVKWNFQQNKLFEWNYIMLIFTELI